MNCDWHTNVPWVMTLIKAEQDKNAKLPIFKHSKFTLVFDILANLKGFWCTNIQQQSLGSIQPSKYNHGMMIEKPSPPQTHKNAQFHANATNTWMEKNALICQSLHLVMPQMLMPQNCQKTTKWELTTRNALNNKIQLRKYVTIVPVPPQFVSSLRQPAKQLTMKFTTYLW